MHISQGILLSILVTCLVGECGRQKPVAKKGKSQEVSYPGWRPNFFDFEIMDDSRLIAFENNWDCNAYTLEHRDGVWSCSKPVSTGLEGSLPTRLICNENEIWLTALIHEFEYYDTAVKPELACSFDAGASWTRITPKVTRLLPHRFIGLHDKSPLLIDPDGQIWIWKRSGKPDLKGLDWMRFGKPNPEHASENGLIAGDSLYISSVKNIWHSTDLGETWSSFRMPTFSNHPIHSEHIPLTFSTQYCYALAYLGKKLYKTKVGTNNWKHVLDFPYECYINDFVADESGLYMAARIKPSYGEEGLYTARFLKYDEASGELIREDLEGLSAYHIRLSPKGKLWISTCTGLHRRDDEKWTLIWPAMKSDQGMRKK